MTIDRRKASVKDLLQRYIADSQKENSHYEGLLRLQEKMGSGDITAKVQQVPITKKVWSLFCIANNHCCVTFDRLRY